MQAIGKFIGEVEASKKVGIIAGVGDRRDIDTISMGEEAAKMFDEIIIRQDRNLRGKTSEEIISLIEKGIRNVNATLPVFIIPKEAEAIDFAIKNAIKDSFITIISDVVPDALEQVKHLKELENNLPMRA